MHSFHSSYRTFYSSEQCFTHPSQPHQTTLCRLYCAALFSYINLIISNKLTWVFITPPLFYNKNISSSSLYPTLFRLTYTANPPQLMVAFSTMISLPTFNHLFIDFSPYSTHSTLRCVILLPWFLRFPPQSSLHPDAPAAGILTGREMRSLASLHVLLPCIGGFDSAQFFTSEF